MKEEAEEDDRVQDQRQSQHETGQQPPPQGSVLLPSESLSASKPNT